jgi:glycine C-acetyltransferase
MAAINPNLSEENLQQWQLRNQTMPLYERAHNFSHFVGDMQSKGHILYRRRIVSPAGREVWVDDPISGQCRPMLMFASNNYLGLANHPHVLAKVQQALRDYGAGIGGPPLLNGYLGLSSQLEERLAALKGKESAMLFSSGYAANLGLVSSLLRPRDLLLYDELSHASFLDGIKLSRLAARSFAHNDLQQLEKQLENARPDSELFVGVEGIYSMDGDMAPLRDIAGLCRRYDAHLIVDDAHGTGVVGPGGAGTAALLGCEQDVAVAMGTFSKTLAAAGGFLAASRDLIEYMRYHARAYVFSASLPPSVQAAVLAGLEVIDKEPWLRDQLHENVRYATRLLSPYGILHAPAGGIIALAPPPGMQVREANLQFHEAGIFINAIEYPAVPLSQERFRISLMAPHTAADIERLAAVVEQVWRPFM